MFDLTAVSLCTLQDLQIMTTTDARTAPLNLRAAAEKNLAHICDELWCRGEAPREFPVTDFNPWAVPASVNREANREAVDDIVAADDCYAR